MYDWMQQVKVASTDGTHLNGEGLGQRYARGDAA